MSKERILWADDEIDLLKPHILFLQNKGYEVETVTNGRDALDALGSQIFNLIILDENMPGISGLEALQRIKIMQPNVPVIMITKSEEEDIMNQAIGSEIADYLIKPVNPMQILLSIKKNLHSEALITEKVTGDYQQEFMRISQMINTAQTIEDWYELYATLVRWELTLSNADTNMDEMLRMQKTEANSAFAKFVKRNYEDWLTKPEHPAQQRVVQDQGAAAARQGREGVLRRHRQFQAGPVAHRESPAGRLFQYRERGTLHDHPAHGNTVCPQRHLFGTDARRHRADVPRPVGR